MSKKILMQVLESILDGDVENANTHFSAYVTSKSKLIVCEDHEKVMTSAQMEKYLMKLIKKAKKEHKEEIAKLLNVTECNKETISTCAKIFANDKKKADRVIHKLEKLVNTEVDPKTLVKESERPNWSDHFDNNREAGLDTDGEDELNRSDRKRMPQGYFMAMDIVERLGRKDLETVLQHMGKSFYDHDSDTTLERMIRFALEDGSFTYDELVEIVSRNQGQEYYK